ncbi:D-inositol-3-phosphate glycosyltransferase [bioreactor metagenome]|uniref:D-inositol-3-phosphate glycosyltransferase n=1 Tax=bioreactor metagenome TaxID=1076179 RepID=A0A645DT83_9ZZZZ
MFKSNRNEYYRNEDFDLNVTYTGSLVPSKGFHVLAKEWKHIIKKVPNAKLNIIGSGKLYDRNSRMGKYGIAEEAYESTFLTYITDDEGNLLNSINFCGVLGQEKHEIYRNTAVGVVNPTGKTETFGLSAVEMEACGIPIVTKAANGLLDTVVHNKTGLLSHTGTQLRKNIIKLLKDKNLNNSLGKQARVFVEKFEPEIIIKEWMILFTESFQNQEIEYHKPINNFSNNLKWLRITNRKLNNAKGKGDFPSVIDLETFVSLYIRRLKKVFR